MALHAWFCERRFDFLDLREWRREVTSKASSSFWWSSDLHSVNIKRPEAYTFEIAHPGYIKIKRQDIRTGNAIRCLKDER